MAPTKYRKRTTRPRRRNWRRRGNRRIATAPRPLVRSDKMIVRLPWETTKVFGTNTNGLTAFQRFRLNSIWDPDFSSGATQKSAMGMVLYQALYKKYRVFGATVQITIDNGTAGVSVPCAIVPSTYAFQGADQIDTMATQPHSTRFLLGNGAGAGSRYKFKRYYKMPHLFGLTSAQYKADDELYGVMGQSDAGQDMILSLGFGDTPSAAGVTLQIRIIYHVELFEPVALAEGLAQTNPEGI